MKKLNIDASMKKNDSPDRPLEQERSSQAESTPVPAQTQLSPEQVTYRKKIYSCVALLLSCGMIVAEIDRLSRIGPMIAANNTGLGQLILYGPAAISAVTFLISIGLLFSEEKQTMIRLFTLPLLLELFYCPFINAFTTDSVGRFFLAMNPGYIILRNLFAIFVCFHRFRKPVIPIAVFITYMVFFIKEVFSLLHQANARIGFEYYTGAIRELAFTGVLLLIALLVSFEPPKEKRVINRRTL